MTYELWDLTTRNLTGFFATEDEALQAVRAAVEQHGLSYVEAFALVQDDAWGRSTTIARGMELVERALANDERNRISA
jgi:hypothetical protein